MSLVVGRQDETSASLCSERATAIERLAVYSWRVLCAPATIVWLLGRKEWGGGLAGLVHCPGAAKDGEDLPRGCGTS